MSSSKPSSKFLTSSSSRRCFLIHALVTTGAASAAMSSAHAAAPKHVEESDDTAVALGYKHDTTKVDKQRFPKHEVSQVCGNCSFFQGGPQDEWAGCAMFGRKQINAKGWCSAWAKKPG
jgi:hypothetical protein